MNFRIKDYKLNPTAVY